MEFRSPTDWETDAVIVVRDFDQSRFDATLPAGGLMPFPNQAKHRLGEAADAQVQDEGAVER